MKPAMLLVLLGCIVPLVFSERLRGTSLATAHSASTLNNMISSLISGDGEVRTVDFINAASKHWNYARAVSVLKKHDVPKELSFLLTKSNTTATADPTYDEVSLGKARDFLNKLIVAGYVELDAILIEAKEWEIKHRQSLNQVIADMARLGEQIANHIRAASDATTCIADTTQKIQDVRRSRQDEQNAYYHQYGLDHAEMVLKQNDLDVFDFLITTTKAICVKQGAIVGIFAQTGQVANGHVQLCDSQDGTSLRFSDPELQSKFDKMLTKGSRDLLRNVLAETRSAMPTSLLQSGEQKQPASGKSKANFDHTAGWVKTEVSNGVSVEVGHLYCPGLPEGQCNTLYDKLSLEWGKYKDQVDELKKEMADRQDAWLTLKAGFDAQIESLTSQLATCNAQLAEAVAKKNADQQELEEKTEEKRTLIHDRGDQWKIDVEKSKEKGNEICAYIIIRNEMMEESTKCPPATIDDCEVTPWNPGECSVACDDTCENDPGALSDCGGIQELTRDIVTTNNDCGHICPQLVDKRRCNQKKCEVDCGMSRWSGWSKCSKDCEGGVEEKTRAVLIRPMHGGSRCGPVSEARPCNTGSCDRDCTLEDWTAWSPCSMACDTGNQYRVRKVDVPIRGEGKCPKPKSHFRYEMQDCNPMACVGDEICTAQQDLIISVDGSGSVSVESWDLVKNFTGEMLKRYKSQYFGLGAVSIGVIQFGNGVIEHDEKTGQAVISKALMVSDLVSDYESSETLKTAVKDMVHAKGFTNMAQGFVLAKKLLGQKGRPDAQHAVMTISDGKPSFLFETREKAKELEDAGIMKYMVGVAEFPGSDEWKLMRELASQPADTNSVFVPGYDALDDGGGPFVREAIAKFCPAAMSPSQTLDQEKVQGYMLVYKKGYCGNLGRTLARNIKDPADCFKLAQEAKKTGFSMGRKYRKGKCCVELLSFTCTDYEGWQKDPRDPKCDDMYGGNQGGFHKSRYYDWYALEPAC
jgi:hypothetical protein